MSKATTTAKADPLRKSVKDLAALLSRAAGKPITEAMIRADLKAGAPKESDGTVQVLNYAAWLARKLGDAA